MPQTSNGQKYRVRYAGYSYRDAYCKVNPRNTLVTIEKDRYIYFGIARCKLSVDHFQKKVGRELALSRAEEAQQMFYEPKFETFAGNQLRSSFFLDEKGERGVCSVKYVKTLLRHFESLDTKE